eukprot:CAMPEP_0114239328 /NCGR_PEP_ID=MMETSP0058-20121206/8400_1 /TAXON_ID=36894 /ORGANISM="Pyramimonas parkeae, CCMP726" /LENGTH=356 /DNA_ID=CAMNT_0001351499 /DNA_START=40 /DNA_END=1110 /DNA_ORIENTATION=-
MIPVSILTGFLGAGKTTLVNHILTAKHGKKIAVIENEFGEIGVDDGLVIETKEEIIEMNNGCICCTVRGDLIRIMHKLLKRKDKFDAILIETTGLADPAPVAQTFFMDEKIKQKAVLDAIITVVDAKHILAHLEEKKPEGVENESVEQVAFADKILLNKVDLVNGKMKATVLAKLRSINAFAEIIETSQSKVAPDRILGVGAFDLNRVMEMDPTFLDEDSEHQHDSTVTSVGIHVEGEVNLERLSDWLSDLLEEKGADIFRSKGLVAVRGSRDKHVFQGVHMMMSLGSSYDGFGRPWKEGEKRENKLVFIGRNLDREELNNSFRKCLVVPRGSKRRLPGACSTSDRITRSNSRARK